MIIAAYEKDACRISHGWHCDLISKIDGYEDEVSIAKESVISSCKPVANLPKKIISHHHVMFLFILYTISKIYSDTLLFNSIQSFLPPF